jgi:hypothetical protein
MPNDGQWQSYPYILPNRILDHKIYDLMNQDSTVPDAAHPNGWSQNDKVAALKEYTWVHSSEPVPQLTQNRLASLTRGVQYAQRLYDISRDPNYDPGDYQAAAQIRNQAGNLQDQAKGTWLDQPFKTVSGWFGANQIDPKYVYGIHALDSFKGGLKDSNLNETEQNELKGIELDRNLPLLIPDVLQKRKDELNQQISNALTNRERIDYGYVQRAKELGADGRGRIADEGAQSLSQLNPPIVKRALPVAPAAPSPTPKLGTARSNPLQVRDQATIDGLGSGIYYQLPNRKIFLTK